MKAFLAPTRISEPLQPAPDAIPSIRTNFDATHLTEDDQ